MRALGGVLGLAGAGLSLLFWVVVPATGIGGGSYMPAGQEAIVPIFAALSAAGVLGSFLGRTHPVAAAWLMAVALIPATGALAIPGVMVLLAILMVLSDPAATTGHPAS